MVSGGRLRAKSGRTGPSKLAASVGVMCVVSDTAAREDKMASAVATLSTRPRDDCLGNKIAEQKQSVELHTRTP
jgi:hypothetical protein